MENTTPPSPYKGVPKESHCDEHSGEICGCGLSVGQMQVRHGILVTVNARGRLHCRAIRAADANLARRVVATMASAAKLGEVPALIANLTSIRETS